MKVQGESVIHITKCDWIGYLRSYLAHANELQTIKEFQSTRWQSSIHGKQVVGLISYSCNMHLAPCIKCHVASVTLTKKPVTTMLTYPWKCTVLHCNHLGNTWKPLVLMTRHFDYCPSASEGDNQSVRSSAPVVSRCFPGGYNVKLYISRGRLTWWLLAFLHSVTLTKS